MESQKMKWSALLAGIWVTATAGFASAQDRFSSWAEMEATGCYEEGWGKEYIVHGYKAKPVCIGSICYFERFQHNLVMAIHGGDVEPWTDEIADEIAQYNRRCVYIGGYFCTLGTSVYQMIADVDEGETCEPENGGDPFIKDNRDLHITATNYDEPKALEMVDEAYTIVTIHGLADSSYAGTDKKVICVGGLNQEMRDDFISRVNNDSLLSGFVRAEDATASGSFCPTSARGISPANIVNMSPTNPDGGLQLEITRTVRDSLFASGNHNQRYRLLAIIHDVMEAESLEVP